MLAIAIPGLDNYLNTPLRGISRVILSLGAQWPNTRQLNSKFVRMPVPFFRNFVGHLQIPIESTMVLLPQMTGAFALKNCPVPSCIIVHDIGVVDCLEDRISMNALTRFSIERSFYSLKYATQIIAVSSFTAQRLALRLPELAPKITVIPSGVSDIFRNFSIPKDESRAKLERLLGRALGNPLLIYVGTELPRKHVSFLLDVLAILKKEYPRAQLLKIGDPGGQRYRTRLMQYSKTLGLGPDDIVFLSSVSDANLAISYRAADVYVSGSRYEGFGLPVLESIAVGTPVVAVDLGSLREIIGPFGTLVPPDPEAFTNAVINYLANTYYDRTVNRHQWIERFSWVKIAEQYLEVMKRCIT